MNTFLKVCFFSSACSELNESREPVLFTAAAKKPRTLKGVTCREEPVHESLAEDAVEGWTLGHRVSMPAFFDAKVQCYYY